MTHRTIGEHFEYHWKNPPPPFNPEFKPHAKKLWDKAVEYVEQHEPFKSRKARAACLRTRYELLMKEHDDQSRVGRLRKKALQS